MKPKELPPIEWLREHLDYNPETGEVLLKKKWGPLPYTLGATLGEGKLCQGYKRIKLKGVTYGAHRIAYALYHGRDPYPYDIDHKDLNKTNNRITNLRKVTRKQNNCNTPQRESKTGHTGITYRIRRKKAWMVTCNRTYIGSYATLDEALTARAEAKQKMQRWSS